MLCYAPRAAIIARAALGVMPSPPIPPPIAPPPAPESEENTALSISLVAFVLLIALLVQQGLRRLPGVQRVVTGSGACILLGAAVNLLALLVSKCLGYNSTLTLGETAAGSGVHDVIYFGLLPPIIFDAGFHMRKRNFFANIGATLGYAVLGTLIAILTTGGLIFALSHAGLLQTGLTLAQAMLFGSLISSTDPVATLGILKHVQAAPLLHDLIFGESALNDALSIVFFAVFRDVAIADGLVRVPPAPPHTHAPPPSSPAPQMDEEGALHVVGSVLRALSGSVATGLVFALLSALVTRALRSQPRGQRPAPPFELALMGLFAVLAFSTPERIDLSGVLSLFVCAIVMRHYTYYNMSSTARRSTAVLFTTISEVRGSKERVSTPPSLVPRAHY